MALPLIAAACALPRLATMLVLAASGSANNAPPPGAPPARSGTVVFGGDVVPHRDLLTSFATHGPASLLAPIAPVVRAADLALINFETPASPAHPLTQTTVRFNVHPDFVQALAAAGFDGASVANNHSYDLGVAPVAATVTTLRGAGLRPIGGALAGEDPMVPQVFPLAGSTLCVFAATRILNYDMSMPGPGAPRIAMARSNPGAEADALLAAVRAWRPRCGAVVVSLHSGVEYQDRPEPIDRVFFRRVAQAGADVVIGHHSHTVQPVELFDAGAGRRVPIFYSLGNFVSNQGNAADANSDPWEGGSWHLGLDPRLREGLLAVMRFESAPSDRLRLAEFGYVPLWTVNTRLRAPEGSAPRISAGLMPRDGGGDPMLATRWRQLVARVGPEYLLPDASLPGAVEGHRVGDPVALENRRPRSAPAGATPPPARTASVAPATAGSTRPRAAASARAQR